MYIPKITIIEGLGSKKRKNYYEMLIIDTLSQLAAVMQTYLAVLHNNFFKAIIKEDV